MRDNNDEVRLIDVVVAQPTVAEQFKLIMQLMQQIAEMKGEMQQRQDALHLDFVLILSMQDLRSTSLHQTWIQLRTSLLHLCIIRL